MEEKGNLVEYKKESFIEKIKNKITRLFFRKKKDDEIDRVKEDIQLSKKDFFEIYEKLKSKEISIEKLDKETLGKVLRIVSEEMELNSNKINEKLNRLKNSLDNAKIYNKEIEIYLKQNK